LGIPWPTGNDEVQNPVRQKALKIKIFFYKPDKNALEFRKKMAEGDENLPGPQISEFILLWWA